MSLEKKPLEEDEIKEKLVQEQTTEPYYAPHTRYFATKEHPYYEKDKFGESHDYIKYKLKRGELVIFVLPKFFNIFKSLNKIRLEKQVEISLAPESKWYFIDDNKKIAGEGQLDIFAFNNLNNLLCSPLEKKIEFLEVWGLLTDRETDISFDVNLEYKIDDVAQSMYLFTLFTPIFPFVQENMEIAFYYSYTTNKQ